MNDFLLHFQDNISYNNNSGGRVPGGLAKLGDETASGTDKPEKMKRRLRESARSSETEAGEFVEEVMPVRDLQLSNSEVGARGQEGKTTTTLSVQKETAHCLGI